MMSLELVENGSQLLILTDFLCGDVGGEGDESLDAMGKCRRDRRAHSSVDDIS